MFYLRMFNNKTDRVHEKALRIEYLMNFVWWAYGCVRYRNMQTLAIEIIKFLNRLSPPIKNEVF